MNNIGFGSLIGVSFVILTLVLNLTPWIINVINVGCGYAAKVACSSVWTAKRDFTLVQRDEFGSLPPLPVWIINTTHLQVSYLSRLTSFHLIVSIPFPSIIGGASNCVVCVDQQPNCNRVLHQVYSE
jgi:hypothetical protein